MLERVKQSSWGGGGRGVCVQRAAATRGAPIGFPSNQDSGHARRTRTSPEAGSATDSYKGYGGLDDVHEGGLDTIWLLFRTAQLPAGSCPRREMGSPARLGSAIHSLVAGLLYGTIS